MAGIYDRSNRSLQSEVCYCYWLLTTLIRMNRSTAVFLAGAILALGTTSSPLVGSAPQKRATPASGKKRVVPPWLVRAQREAESVSMSRMTTRFQSRFPKPFQDVMDHADTVAIYSLGGLPTNPDTFHGYLVRGRTQVLDREEIDNLRTIVGDSITTPRGPNLCFVPHHGLRFVRGSKRVDALICFTCKQMYVQMGTRYAWFNITQSTLPTLNDVFRKAGIPAYELRPELISPE